MATSALRHWVWVACFICVGALGVLVSAYTLETVAAVRFRGTVSDEFGYGVIQHRDGHSNKWLVVSAPLAQKRQGSLHKCQVHPRSGGGGRGSCALMFVQGNEAPPNSVLGLTLARENDVRGKVMACAPLGNIGCGKNVFLKSTCYLFDENLSMKTAIMAGFQECPLSPIDMVILIDGSGSVNTMDFQKTKNFIQEIFRVFQRKSNVQIAVVQFSTAVKEEISFRTFISNPNLMSLVSNIQQMSSSTYTGKALNFIMDRVFVSASGARANAQKVLVIVTDGASNGGGLNEAVARTQINKVVTYAIGVGNAFNPGSMGYSELRLLATDPDNDHLFSVTNYNALDSVLKSLEERIFGIEGASGDLSTFELELAGTGLSALMDPDSITFGAVGAHGWMGGVVRRFPDGHSVTSSNSSLDRGGRVTSGVERDSYLGYSLARLRFNSLSLLASGAPHSRHTGSVFLFEIRTNDPRLKIYKEIRGLQLGSYFGATVCAIDMDEDGATDLLLVSAPFLHVHGEEGKVYVYERSTDFSLTQELKGMETEVWGRFGSAVASMGDVTGDGWPDVAVGAPGDEEGAGAVYLFHGESGRFSRSYSQRISGKSQGAGVKMFGRSLSANMDVSGDDLVDLAVGALGDALLLRSRPIVNVSVVMTSSPARIPLHETRCPESSSSSSSHSSVRSSIVALKICFSSTSIQGERRIPAMTVNYTIALDVSKRVPRATFSPRGGEAGELSSQGGSVLMGDTAAATACVGVAILVTCEGDDLSSPIPVVVSFEISSPLSGVPVPVLNQQLHSNLTAQLHFQKDCGADEVCVSDLQVEITLDSAEPLLLGELQALSAHVVLRNRGEEASKVRLKVSVPPNLQYRSATPSPAVRNVECSVSNAILECSIDNPVMKASTEVHLKVEFDIAFNDTSVTELTLTAIAYSANEERSTLQDNTASVRRSVRYSVNVVLKGADSLHLSYNKSETEDKPVSQSFTVRNLGDIATTVRLEIRVPTSTSRSTGAFLTIGRIVTQPAGGVCKILDNSTIDVNAARTQTHEDAPVWDCHNTRCSRILCSGLSLRPGETADVTMALSISVQSLVLDALPKRVILSDAHLAVEDAGRFQLSSNRDFHSSQARIIMEFHEIPNHLPLYIGSTIGGLVLLTLITAALYKAGFFKRHYKAMVEEANQEGTEQTEPEPVPAAPEPSTDL